jgi:hypothetical protein
MVRIMATKRRMLPIAMLTLAPAVIPRCAVDVDDGEVKGG